MKAIRCFCILVLIVILSSCLVAAQEKWYRGIIHFHSTFSDSSDNIPQRVQTAKNEGCQFTIPTDHYEQIPLKNKGGKYAGTDFGFDDYLRNCREQTSANFACIPGAEIASFWNPELNTACSHTLILGFANYDQTLSELQMKNGSQQAIINRIKELGYLSVAAHPTLISELTSRWHFWRDSDFRYDLRPANEQTDGQIQYQNISGLEMFNIENQTQQEDLVRRYLDLTYQKVPVFVTAGCDSHKWFPFNSDKDKEMWGRQTWVYANNLSPQDIIDGLREGCSYAANYRARFGYLSPTPGFEKKILAKAELRCSLVFEKPTSSPKTIQIYRDGRLIEKSVQNYASGISQVDYCFTDEEAAEGEHWYVIEVPMTLITSSIVLDIKHSPPISSESSIIMLVMDASGSMKGDKINTAKRAAQAFIDFCKTDDFVGISEFSNIGKFILAPTKVAIISKEELKRKLYQNPDEQSTNMGGGLEIAIREFDKIKNVEANKKSIVLMSDGMHNTGQLWPFVENCKRKGYKIYTVAFGNDADLLTLEKIASETGGECSFGSIRNLVQIYNFVSNQIKKESTFYASSSWLKQNQKISYKIPIFQQSASFFCDWQGSKVEMTLVNPQNQKINPEQAEKYIIGENYQYCRIKNPVNGEWQVHISGIEIPNQGEQINFTAAGEDEVYVSLLPLKTSYNPGKEIQIIVKACGIDKGVLVPLDLIEIKGNICQPAIRPNEFIQHKTIFLDKLLLRAVNQNKSLHFEPIGNNKFQAKFTSKMSGLHRIKIIARTGFKVDNRKKLIERNLQASIMVGKIEDFTINNFLEMFR